MDGKPLYEYAREGKALPRPIPTRKCTVSIDLVDFTPASKVPGDGGHEYRWPSKLLNPDEKAMFRRLTEMVSDAQPADSPGLVDSMLVDLDGQQVPETSAKGRPATFKVRMTVSSGTYVRSIVHEIGLALGCAAHVVSLTRTRQGEFVLHGDEDTSSIPWSTWECAIFERRAIRTAERSGKEAALAAGNSVEEVDQEFGDEAIFAKRRTGELKEWEKELLRRFVAVPVSVSGKHDPY